MSKDIQTITNELFNKIEQEEYNPNRQTTKGIINNTSNTGILYDENGDVSNISSSLNQDKYNNESKSSTSISVERKIITNRLSVDTDDVVLNGHKLNPQLSELADIRMTSNTCVQGNLNMFGTVLVKMYEPYLNKFVYVRRYIRTPIFGQTLTQPVINEQFDLFKTNTVKVSEDT